MARSLEGKQEENLFRAHLLPHSSVLPFNQGWPPDPHMSFQLHAGPQPGPSAGGRVRQPTCTHFCDHQAWCWYVDLSHVFFFFLFWLHRCIWSCQVRDQMQATDVTYATAAARRDP